MRLQVLESAQLDCMRECKLSLLLGVSSSDNKIERYMRVARAIINTDNAVFSFHNEPYLWAANAKSDFLAFPAQEHIQHLAPCFEDNVIVVRGHSNDQKFSEVLHSIADSHKRFLFYDFRLESGESIAHIIFYDDAEDDFTARQQDLLVELTSGLVTILQRKYESEDYYDLYKQQRALNISKTRFFQIIAHDLRAPFMV